MPDARPAPSVGAVLDELEGVARAAADDTGAVSNARAWAVGEAHTIVTSEGMVDADALEAFEAAFRPLTALALIEVARRAAEVQSVYNFEKLGAALRRLQIGRGE